MYRVSTERVAINQATGKGLIIRILFDDFTLKNADKDFIERQAVGLGFFIGVVSNSYSLITYRVNDVFDSHLVLPFKQVTEDGVSYTVILPQCSANWNLLLEAARRANGQAEPPGRGWHNPPLMIPTSETNRRYNAGRRPGRL